MANSKTLKQAIEEQKPWYISKYGQLDWHWDEAILMIALDWLSSYEPMPEDHEYFYAETGITLDKLMED